METEAVVCESLITMFWNWKPSSEVNVSGGTSRRPVNVTLVVWPASTNGLDMLLKIGAPWVTSNAMVFPAPPNIVENCRLRKPTVAIAPIVTTAVADVELKTVIDVRLTSAPETLPDKEGV